MLTIIDRYIIKKFLGSFVYAILLVVVISVVFDLSEKLDDFLKRDAPLGAIIFDYYLNFIPYFINLFSFLFIFISVVFFTSRMAQQTEIIAIINAGVSFRRLLVPYFITATILALFSFTLTNYILPFANRQRLEFENTYINNKIGFTENNIHRQLAPGQYVYFQSYNTLENRGHRFTLEVIVDNKLISKLSAETCQWDSLKNKWSLRNYRIHTFGEMSESIKTGFVMDTALNLHPSEFVRRVTNVQTLTYGQLSDFIDKEQKRGAGDIEYYMVEKYQRTSMPFAAFILTLIGASLSTRKARGGIGLNIAFGFIISFSYILFMQVSSTFATNGSFHPALAAWTPNIIFLILGIYLAIKAPK